MQIANNKIRKVVLQMEKMINKQLQMAKDNIEIVGLKLLTRISESEGIKRKEAQKQFDNIDSLLYEIEEVQKEVRETEKHFLNKR